MGDKLEQLIEALETIARIANQPNDARDITGTEWEQITERCGIRDHPCFWEHFERDVTFALCALKASRNDRELKLEWSTGGAQAEVKPSFDEAVKIAVGILQHPDHDGAARRRMGLRAVLAMREGRFNEMQQQSVPHPSFKNNNDAKRRQRRMFDAMCYGIAWQLRAEQRLALDATAWLVDYLEGKIEVPPRPGGAPPKGNEADTIWLAVAYLEQRGVRPYRNKATESEESGCDAVAQAARDLKYTRSSYDAVRNIYSKLKTVELPIERTIPLA